jgi:hypothetical protein
MVSSEMSQIAGNESAGLTGVELASLVPPLQNHVLQDHESRPPPAAGTKQQQKPKYINVSHRNYF